MSLIDLKETLLTDIRTSTAGRAVSEKLHVIYEESIHDAVVAALRLEIKQDRKFDQVIKRIPDINLTRKITNKLAKVYNKPASRKVKGGVKDDQKLVDFYTEALSLNSKMSLSNKMLELGRACALEPYLDKQGLPKIRVLTNYQVRVYSGNPDDPLEMNVLTKLMGQMCIMHPTDKAKTKWVNYYHSYSANEFMVWHDEGVLYVQPNPLGLIPFIWINSSEFQLNPYAPQSDIDSAVLVPKYYADLFYAMSYTAHSLIVGIDLELPNSAVYDPGAMLDLKSSPSDYDTQKQGRLEVVTPQIKIAEALALIQQAINDMLESKGIKPPQSCSNSLERPNASAALIESADASSHILQRCNFYFGVETALWSLIKQMHKFWLQVPSNRIAVTSEFSPDFKVDVLFGEVKPVEVRTETLANLAAQRALGLMSRKQMLEDLYPQFTDAQIEAYLKEAESDAIKIETPPAPVGGAKTSDRTSGNPKDKAPNPGG